MKASLGLPFCHCIGAAGCLVVTFNASGSSPLYSYQLVDVGGCVWVPDCACVLQDGSDKGLVGLGLDDLWAAFDVSSEE